MVPLHTADSCKRGGRLGDRGGLVASAADLVFDTVHTSLGWDAWGAWTPVQGAGEAQQPLGPATDPTHLFSRDPGG